MIGLNRKDLYSRDKFLDWLKKLKKELLEQNTVLLVEGKNDKTFFTQLGFDHRKIIQIASLTTEQLLEKLGKSIPKDQVTCIPLVDFDREGKKLLTKIKNLNMIRFQKNKSFMKIRIDNYFRNKLSSMLMGKHREIEDLTYYVEKMQISSVDI